MHVYQPDGERLTRRRLVCDVSTHRIGTRETDLAAWLQGLLVLPSQDGRRLRMLDPAADWSERAAVPLTGRATLTTALVDFAALAVLLDDGRVVVIGPPGRPASRG